MHRLPGPLRYGLIGIVCAVGSVIGYYIASSVLATPYGMVESFSMSAEQLKLEVGLICTAVLLFTGAYMIVLTLFERIAGAVVASQREIMAAGFYAALVQMVATFCTDAFTRSKVGWGLNEIVSVPIAIAGATLPGLVTAAFLLHRSRDESRLHGGV